MLQEKILKKAAQTTQLYKKKNISTQVLSTIELCAGAGGMALGLEKAGFKHLAMLDNNPHACATLRRNRPYWNVIEADLTKFNAAYWSNIDLVSGGLPCPPFSIAGKQLGSNDDRDLFPSMLRIVSETQPRAVLIENVKGLLSSRFDIFRNNISEKFDKLGFDTYWKLYNATDFLVPQSRFRVFLVALKRGQTKTLKWPEKSNLLPKTVGESLNDLMGERGWKYVDEWTSKANKPAPTIVGGSHKHGGPDLGPTRARLEWQRLGVDGLGLADLPPGPDFTGLPRLTIRMVARLQGFPDDWIFSGSKTQAYRQVGNALPVELAYNLAKAVKQCLD